MGHILWFCKLVICASRMVPIQFHLQRHSAAAAYLVIPYRSMVNLSCDILKLSVGTFCSIVFCFCSNILLLKFSSIFGFSFYLV